MPVAEQPCTHRQVSQIFVVRNVSGVHHLSCVVGNSKFLIDVCSVHGLDEYIYYVSVYSISNLLKLSEPNSMLTLVITGTCSSVSRVKKTQKYVAMEESFARLLLQPKICSVQFIVA